MIKLLYVMWKGSYLVINLQRIISQLCNFPILPFFSSCCDFFSVHSVTGFVQSHSSHQPFLQRLADVSTSNDAGYSPEFFVEVSVMSIEGWVEILLRAQRMIVDRETCFMALRHFFKRLHLHGRYLQHNLPGLSNHWWMGHRLCMRLFWSGTKKLCIKANSQH